jgi:hypothetical protein
MDPATPYRVPAGEPGYTGAPVVGAVLATIFFPIIALIAALILQGSETNPTKKSQLRMWAWISGGWLALGLVMFFMVLIAFGVFAATVAHHIPRGIDSQQPHAARASPCRGGPNLNSVPTPIPGTDKYIFPCRFGGTTTVVMTGLGH